MIKATDLIKKETVFIANGHEFNKIKAACSEAAITLYKTKLFAANDPHESTIIIEKYRKLAARFEREFIRASTDFREENVFHFTLFLQFEPSLKEVMRAFREDITFYGSVNINSINEIKKDFKENYRRTSDIREIFNKGYGAYLVKAKFSEGDFDEPSYWDLEVISHYKF